MRRALLRGSLLVLLAVLCAGGSIAVAATSITYSDQGAFFADTGIGSPTQTFDSFEDGTCLDSYLECQEAPGLRMTSSVENLGDDAYTEIHVVASELGPTQPNELRGGYVPGSVTARQAMVITFSPPVNAAGFYLTGLAPVSEFSFVEPATVTVSFDDSSEAAFSDSDSDGDETTAEYFGIVSDAKILQITVTSGWISGSFAIIEADLFGLDNLSFVTYADSLPPLCSRGDLPGVPTSQINGIATDERLGDTGIVELSLLPGATNVALEIDSSFPEIGGIPEALFHVNQIDTAQDGQGVVLATDEAGGTCTLRVDFTALPPAPLVNVVLCSGDGILFEVANETNPGGTSACSSSLYTPVEPPLPPGYEPSPDTDPFPCRVLTIESPISGTTEMVYKKDGAFDPRMRLLFSESLDGGLTFPPFIDVTTSVREIADIVPDPIRLGGTVQWTPVKITCAILAGVDCGTLDSPDLDQDEDGYSICSEGQRLDCNDQLDFVHPGAPELCNGMDDNCDEQIDEGNPEGGGACQVAGKLGACAEGSVICDNGELVCTQTVFPTAELCDGVDNDCDGEIDEGGDALCDDRDVCDGVETCGGASGCEQGPSLACDDGNPCTDDSCDPETGCQHVASQGSVAFFSTASTQFLAGRTVKDGDVVELASCSGGAVPVSGGSIPSSLGIDALDVQNDGSATFSVRSAGGIHHAGGFLQLRPENVYSLDPASGEIRVVVDWRSIGIDMADIDALDLLSDGSLAFSTSVLRGVRHAGGYTVLRPQNVYRFDPATRTIDLLFDGVVLGLPDLDGVDILPDGRIAFSTKTNVFVHGVYVKQQNAYTLERDGSLTLSLDGERIGLLSLDDFALD